MLLRLFLSGMTLCALTACGPVPESKSPMSEMKLVKAEAGKARGVYDMTLGDIIQVASSGATMSCAELDAAKKKSFLYDSFSSSESGLIKADADAKAAMSLTSALSGPRLDAEIKCHCDGVSPMAGFELYERRKLLLADQPINPDYAALYPKDDSGKPRHLMPGESISDSVLEQLPPVNIPKHQAQCGRACKAARGRTNARALAEGKPEPFPNLLEPPKLACTAAELATLRAG